MNKGTVLSYALFVLIGASSGLFWYVLAHIGDFYLWNVYVSPLALLLVLLVFIFLSIIISEISLAFLGLALTPLLSFALFGFKTEYLPFVIISLLVFAFAMKSSLQRKAESLTINFYELARGIKGYVGFALMILLAGLIYTGVKTADRITMPKQLFEYAVRSSDPIIKLIDSSLDVHAPIDDILARQILLKQGNAIDLASLSLETQNLIKGKALGASGEIDMQIVLKDKELMGRISSELAEKVKKTKGALLKQGRDNLSDRFEITKLTGDEKLSEVLYLIANSYIIKYSSGAYGEYAPAAVAFLGFLFLKSFFWILILVSVSFAHIIFILLRRFGVIKIERVSTEKEVIVV